MTDINERDIISGLPSDYEQKLAKGSMTRRHRALSRIRQENLDVYEVSPEFLQMCQDFNVKELPDGKYEISVTIRGNLVRCICDDKDPYALIYEVFVGKYQLDTDGKVKLGRKILGAYVILTESDEQELADTPAEEIDQAEAMELINI